MNSLADHLVVRTLDRLHAEAAISDDELVRTLMAKIEAPGATVEQFAADAIAEERADYRGVYHGYADNFLAVSPDYGRFLYMMARTSRATRIVEFGTSMGISTIYLATALRDNGGGQLIGSELEPTKVVRARANLDSAGLAGIVDIREGDALETLGDPGGAVDLLMLDGAFSLYLPVLRLIEPYLRPGAIVLAENALEPGYRDHVRDPANGYVGAVSPMRTALHSADSTPQEAPSAGERLPLGQGDRAALLVSLSVNEMSFLIEVIVDAAVD